MMIHNQVYHVSVYYAVITLICVLSCIFLLSTNLTTFNVTTKRQGKINQNGDYKVSYLVINTCVGHSVS